MSKPTIKELDEHLRGLVEWKGFALHLPEVDETDINIIAKNKRDDVVDQKRVLYETWLKAFPHASWDDVIQALEKVKENAIASNLRAKFPAVQAAVSPKQPAEVQEQVPNKQIGAILIEKDVHMVDELQRLHSTFVSLATDVRQEVAKKVDGDEKILKDFICHIEEEKAFNIELQSVQTTDQFFNAIRPHYNFLDFHIIKSLAHHHQLSGHVDSKAQEYEKQTKTFMEETKIGALRQKLEPYFTASKSGAEVSVSVELQNAWGTHSVWLVKQLVVQLFSLQNSDQLQWLQVVSKCLLVVFSAPKQMKQSLIENSSRKLQFMKLTGVISLQIENVFVLKEEEKDTFSFEDSLVQAKIQKNTEAVQLLEQCIQETSSLATMLKDESDDTHQDQANLSKKLLPKVAGLPEKRNDAGKPKKGRKMELVHIQTTDESKRLLHSSEVEFSWKEERVDGIKKQEVSEVTPASESDISLAFLPRMCGCGKCISVGWKTDISHQSIHSSKIPMVLATEHKPSPAPFFNQKCDSQATLCIATSGIIDHFQLVVSDIWKQLHDSVNDQKADISTITCTLCSELSIQIPLFSDLDSVQNYCHSLRVSWYNFCPLHLLVTRVMAQLSPSLLADWNSYLTRYRDFCSAYNLKDFADVSFGEEKHNTFLLEVDKCYCNFTLLDIEHINASLSIAIGYPSVCLRLLTLTVKQQSLIIYFYYCCADYLTVFKSLSMIQLKTISEIETYRILSLTDSHNQFKHHNIQDYAKASPMNTISSSAAEHGNKDISLVIT